METQAALYTGSSVITPEDMEWSWGHLVSLLAKSGSGYLGKSQHRYKGPGILYPCGFLEV